MKVLVSGIAGFAGGYLAQLALDHGVEVHGTVFTRREGPAVADLRERVTLHPCDLTDLEATRRVLRQIGPDWIFHLAGWSAVSGAWEHRAEALRTNVQTTFSLLEGVRVLKLAARVLLVSSGAVYGAVPEARQPISEELPPRPLTPYALSKACVELYAAQYVQGEGLDIVTVRPFNHLGPRQGPGFVCADLARQIVAIEEGRAQALEARNLEARRDFTDVRDMVRAYWLALACGRRGEVYNIASGKAVSIRELVDRLTALALCPVPVHETPGQWPYTDPPVLVGDPAKFRALTGWMPHVPLERTLTEILQGWRRRSP